MGARQYMATGSVRSGYGYVRGWVLPRFLLLVFLLILSQGCFLPRAFASFVNARRGPVQSVSWASAQESMVVAAGVVASSEHLQTLNGPQKISLLTVNLTNPRVRLGVVAAHDQLSGQDETVSSMANRSGAVAGINGDFFEINATGAALGMVEINGQLLQSPASFEVLGVNRSGRVTIGAETFVGNVDADGSSYPLHSLNRHSDIYGNNLTLFTPALGSSLPLRGGTAALLEPVANSANTFTLQAIRAGQKSLPVLHGQVALVGSGSAGKWLSAHLGQQGETIHISEHIAPDSRLVQAIGGGSVLIKNGVFYHDPAALTPGPSIHTSLTAVGLSRDGRAMLLAVCNGGRADSLHSKGFTGAEMAGYLLAHGVYQAILLDGGGSSEMVARLPGQSSVSVLNAPSDHHERPVANGWFVYSVAR
jgi:exopolysaccharide biosynthesis protein